ncbi:hypothetical protein NC652_037617 [Populus alba x Populus x berolinensis]|nr:hypothetical protein NC652_037617 [Populus alba x Populus x berolinensis]
MSQVPAFQNPNFQIQNKQSMQSASLSPSEFNPFSFFNYSPKSKSPPTCTPGSKSINLGGKELYLPIVTYQFEPYDSHWRLTWSLTSGPVGLVEYDYEELYGALFGFNAFVEARHEFEAMIIKIENIVRFQAMTLVNFASGDCGWHSSPICYGFLSLVALWGYGVEKIIRKSKQKWSRYLSMDVPATPCESFEGLGAVHVKSLTRFRGRKLVFTNSIIDYRVRRLIQSSNITSFDGKIPATAHCSSIFGPHAYGYMELH